MRILIVTAGSRGDVAPFTGLGQRLRQAGHQVAVAAHEPFAELVRECGLDYLPLPGDPQQLVRARLAATSPEEARSINVEFLQGLAEGVIKVADSSTDLLLTALGPAPLSRLAAEALGIHSMGVYLLPSVPTGEFPLPGLPDSGSQDRAANLEAGRALMARASLLYQDVLPALRTRLVLPATPATDPAARRWPICHGYSPSVLPRPADWPAQVQVHGYWWPARSPRWQPPAELADFLAAGPPPVFVGFGSMAPGQAGRLSELITTAAAKARVRVVVQAGWAGLASVGDDTMLAGDLPHDWLFPQTAAVVHHAGAGTTGAGLRAGVPTIAIPVTADQPFWARRLHHLGVAPPPIPFDDLTAQALANALRTCLDEPAYQHRARTLAQHIATEDGPTATLDRINRLKT